MLNCYVRLHAISFKDEIEMHMPILHENKESLKNIGNFYGAVCDWNALKLTIISMVP